MLQDNLLEKCQKIRKNITRQFIANSKRPNELLQDNLLVNTEKQKNYITRQFTNKMLKKQKKYYKTIYKQMPKD